MCLYEEVWWRCSCDVCFGSWEMISRYTSRFMCNWKEICELGWVWKQHRIVFPWNPSSSNNSFLLFRATQGIARAHTKSTRSSWYCIWSFSNNIITIQVHQVPQNTGYFPHTSSTCEGNIRRHIHSFSWKCKLFQICLTESRLWVKVLGKAPWL